MSDKSKSPQARASTLLAWYDRHARELPWRVSPHDRSRDVMPDPYRVWLSEIMLQQTTVAAVKSYFEAFTSRWLTLPDLASASEDDVLKMWAGLGYYSRARNLKKCADEVLAHHNGEFPPNVDLLKSLPGIGDYTSAAIGAIAFDLPAAVVDGNVERVITRVFAIETPLPAAKPEIKQRVAAMVPNTRPGDFAQAMMDLGATICTPKRPTCLQCPWRDECKAVTVDAERFPIKTPKKKKPLRRGAAFVAVDVNGAILLEKRSDTGLLAGMTQVPTTGWTSRIDGETSAASAPFPAEWQDAGSIRHVFTHFELELTVYFTQVSKPLDVASVWWSSPDELADEALPTVMKKAISCAMPDAFKRTGP